MHMPVSIVIHSRSFTSKLLGVRVASLNQSIMLQLTVKFGGVHRIWMSYLNPIFWSVYGLIISQVDNLNTGCTLITGQVVPVYDAVLIIFGYQ